MKDLFDVELAMSAKEQSVELQKKGLSPGKPLPLSELVMSETDPPPPVVKER